MVPFSTARHPGPEAATQLQTITPQSNFHDGMIDLSVFYPKVLEIIKIFFGKIEMSLNVFAQQRFSFWSSAMRATFADSLYYGGVMDTDLN